MTPSSSAKTSSNFPLQLIFAEGNPVRRKADGIFSVGEVGLPRLLSDVHNFLTVFSKSDDTPFTIAWYSLDTANGSTEELQASETWPDGIIWLSSLFRCRAAGGNRRSTCQRPADGQTKNSRPCISFAGTFLVSKINRRSCGKVKSGPKTDPVFLCGPLSISCPRKG